MSGIILTGDRPTGRLHIGHYVGSLRQRVTLQDSGEYSDIFIMMADTQALTDYSDNPQLIRDSVTQIALDWLAAGLDPAKSTLFIQSAVPELSELTMYYMNLVTVARLERNPTVKTEIRQRGFDTSIPVGFLNYPVSQASDISIFKADTVPVGEDQLPMIEQTNEIVRRFNATYGDVMVECKAMVPEDKASSRLPGTDGQAKMSKSLGNAIYLSDDSDTIRQKVMSMFTDPGHLKVSDPGKVEGNPVFMYLDAFSTTDDFTAFLPEYDNLDALKEHYMRGGLGDVKVKRFLNEVLQDRLRPIRERREELAQDLGEVMRILEEGSRKARARAQTTMDEVRQAMRLDYFN